METLVIDTLEEFASLAPAWDALLERSGLTDPYLSSAWIDAWWREYAGEGERLHVVCCFDGEQLVGALPARLAVGSSTTLALLGDDTVAPTRPGCIAEPSLADQVYRCISSYLARHATLWEVVSLHAIDTDSPFVATLLGELEDVSVQSGSNQAELVPLHLPPSWDEFLESLSSSMRRRSVNKFRHNLEARGMVAVELIEDPELLDAALEDTLGMFAQGMSRRFERRFAFSERHRRFITRVSAAFLAQDRLRLIFLTVDDERVSFAHGFKCGDTRFAYQTGFDDAWSDLHVGTLITGYVLEQAIAEGCTRYDFGPGRGEHKSRWGAAATRDLQDVRIYRRSVRGTTARLKDAAVRDARRVARRVMPDSIKRRLTRKADWRELERL